MNDLSQKRELYNQAREFTENPAFDEAIKRINARINGGLLNATTAEEKLDLVNQLKIVDLIVNELKSIIEDYKLAVRRQHG